MKKILNIILALFLFTQLNAQLDVRATCKSTGFKIQAFIKPTTAPIVFSAPSGTNQLAMIIVFSLPANGAINTNSAPVPVSFISPFGFAMLHYPTQVVNDRYIYTYYNNPANLTGSPAPWAMNSETLVLELTFNVEVQGMFPRLDNLLNTTPNGFDYFYFEVNGTQRSDTEGTPFYPTVGIYPSADQFIQAATPLPVTLVSFNAEKYQDRSSHITWTTASESNSSHFVVERSFNQKTWSKVGTVKAAGESQIINNYELIDNNVYNGRDAHLTAYYRLIMVDLDGQVKNSPIQSVVFGNGVAPGRDIVVYPNPAKEGVQVAWDANRIDQPTSLEFFDLQGKLVYTQKVSDNTDQEYIDFSKTSIQPGLYLLRILNGAEPIDFKQIVVGQR